MPRRVTVGTAGLVFHVVNRGVRRLRLFEHENDYGVWLQAFAEAQARVPVDVFAYCVMPNHFHLVLRPNEDGHLSEFMRLGTLTHSMRWHRLRGTSGYGAVYQGRYRACPIQTDRYFFNACRYVEGNALRAALVTRAEHWRWSSLAARCGKVPALTLCNWPLSTPPSWLDIVNDIPGLAELEAIRVALRRGVPLGDPAWSERTAESLGLSGGLRAAHRPRQTG